MDCRKRSSDTKKGGKAWQNVTKRQEVIESHYYPCLERIWYIKKKCYVQIVQ